MDEVEFTRRKRYQSDRTEIRESPPPEEAIPSVSSIPPPKQRMVSEERETTESVEFGEHKMKRLYARSTDRSAVSLEESVSVQTIEVTETQVTIAPDTSEESPGEERKDPEAPFSSGSSILDDEIILVMQSLGMISEEKKQRIMAEAMTAGERPYRVALRGGYVSSLQIAEALAKTRGLDFEPSIGEKVDRTLLINHVEFWGSIEAVPMKETRRENELVVVIHDPSRMLEIEGRIREKNLVKRQASIHFKITSKDEIEWILTEMTAMIPVRVDATTMEFMDASLTPNELIDKIIKKAYRMRGTDIHLEPFENTVRIRYRVQGDLMHIANITKQNYAELRHAILHRAESLSPHIKKNIDGVFNMKIGQSFLQVRTSFMPTIHEQQGATLRLLDSRFASITLETLGFPSDEVDVLMGYIKNTPNGMILVTGPTSAGKSSTVHAIINSVDSDRLKIIDIGDPIEYRRSTGLQCQVWKTKADRGEDGWSFTDAMKGSLRSDPDIIIVGEIREESPAAIAVQAGRTGHLVFSTIHVDRTFEIFGRFTDYNIKLMDVLSVGRIFINQRLVRKLCQECRVQVPSDKYRRTTAHNAIINAGIETLYDRGHNPSCPACYGKGYVGRYAIAEILLFNDELVEFLSAPGMIEKPGLVLEKLYKRQVNKTWKSLMDKAIHESSVGNAGISDVAKMLGIVPMQQTSGIGGI